MMKLKNSMPFVLALAWSVPSWADPPSERLLLVTDLKTHAAQVKVGLMKPFEVHLVAERDAEKPQVSTVAFKFEVPDGLLVVGEELLVESLVALGTPRAGLNLAFHCVTAPQVPLYRFRLVATRPLQGAELRLLPSPRDDFRGIVACKDEDYAKWDTAESVLRVTAR